MSETVFKEVRYDLSSLIKFIELGEIGLPDIQRPFVWKNAKVRDLFDSMYRGYPVGYLLLWQNALADAVRSIGAEDKQKPPRLLVVDGQQRLTSLYAVVKNIPVVRDNFATESIQIAFNPLLEKFEVADAAIRRDKAYIPDISRLWSEDTDIFEVVEDYLTNLETTREVSSDEKKLIKKAIVALQNLLSFPFTALELSATINEEDVADVFVRINSKGTPLNQADFILTLMSVFWDKGRAELEKFCRESRVPSTGKPSPFNHFIHPDPDQLLRVNVGLGFKRARLRHVYSILRGKDLETGEFSEHRRAEQFEVLQKAQEQALDLNHWHDFMQAVRQAGIRNLNMISSQTNLLFAYTLYLLGRTEYGADEFRLRQAIARWLFMSSLTARFTSSPESAMEFDLARLRDVSDADTFVGILDRVSEQVLTDDFWSITLPNDLATSSPRSPSLFAYFSALVLLEARVLFSKSSVAEMLDASSRARRAAIERHHLFPKEYLKGIGITQTRDRNQIANYALVEWGDNASIASQAPEDYVPSLRERFSAAELERMYYWHALPDAWESLPYEEFLIQRRERIAEVIADAYRRLSAPGAEKPTDKSGVPIEELLTAGESTEVEFKSTLRVNLHTGAKDPRMELSCLKTLAGFLNVQGGTLVIGVSDDGEPVGIEVDQFPNEDKMSLHLVNLIKDRMGPQYMTYLHPRFEDYQGQRAMMVECWPAKSPVFVKDGQVERFFIRTGPSTTELTASQIQAYIKQRFRA